MAIPFFYINQFNSEETTIALDEETSKHVVQVLRMQTGEPLQLTDGQGNLLTTKIIDNNKRKAVVKLLSTSFQQASTKKNSIAISLIKNTHRFEWFLEKATEIGVNEIVPILCTRTEKQHFRYDRMKGILISAMLQSQQCWLPVLHEPVKFSTLINRSIQQQKFIAHCEKESSKLQLAKQPTNHTDRLILIGPEGDFTKEEIESALKNNFVPVALGNTRLRTETAGVVAAALLVNSE